ncbi:MAG: hypothetical protein COB33_012540 [Thiotrichaceae bacterium]|nr:hypothetical protein [Thiotrichaceae bacterium]MBL1261346.1 hypothetical protein [Thiotrichaceae bacterium]PCI12990.1 MAG: hypothetical protein COB71_07145 [Thiotrichales bacterium]
MNMKAYKFHFRDDDSIKRLPMAQWNRIQRREACFTDCKNQIICLAFAYIELLEKKESKNMGYFSGGY